MKTILKVEDMSCGHCVKAVTEIISEINGVEAVEVSLADATATVTYSDVDIQKVVDALNETNYKASL